MNPPEPIMLRPERGGGVELCHTCGQALPSTDSYLTARELDVLTCWWMTGSVKQAASVVGVSEQRAKNLLARARMRNRAGSNDRLLALHFIEVRQTALKRMSHNLFGSEAR